MRQAVVLAVFLVGSMACEAASGSDRIESDPFFRSLAGEWTGKGELLNAEGTTISVEEKWKAGPKAGGTFAIEGSRQWDGETQEYSWIFSYNSTTELFECEYQHTGMEQPIRFEVSLTEKSGRLVATMGGDGGELVIVNTLTDDGMRGEVSLKNAQGQEVLGGTIEHRRQS